jgi:hypothetical protein
MHLPGQYAGSAADVEQRIVRSALDLAQRSRRRDEYISRPSRLVLSRQGCVFGRHGEVRFRVSSCCTAIG